jgi:hypothetical protein
MNSNEIDPKMIWYSISDRYSLDFEAITHFLNQLKENNSKNDDPIPPSIMIDYILDAFQDRFDTIKGDHILNQMELAKNPTLNPLSKFNFLSDVKTENIDIRLFLIDPDNEDIQKRYSWFISADSVLDILTQNIKHNSNHEEMNNNETVRKTQDTLLHVYHYFLNTLQTLVDNTLKTKYNIKNKEIQTNDK